jgi:hypothetical protein
MKKINSLLSRFQNITPPNDAIRRAVAKAISDIAGVKIKREDVTLQRGVAFIKCSSVAKSVIRSSRSAILSEIVRELPSARDTVRDLR